MYSAVVRHDCPDFTPVPSSSPSFFGFGPLRVFETCFVLPRNPEKYRSVSTFSAICHPVECAWGKKAFGGYLGGDKAAWKVSDTGAAYFVFAPVCSPK